MKCKCSVEVDSYIVEICPVCLGRMSLTGAGGVPSLQKCRLAGYLPGDC